MIDYYQDSSNGTHPGSRCRHRGATSPPRSKYVFRMQNFYHLVQNLTEPFILDSFIFLFCHNDLAAISSVFKNHLFLLFRAAYSQTMGLNQGRLVKVAVRSQSSVSKTLCSSPSPSSGPASSPVARSDSALSPSVSRSAVGAADLQRALRHAGRPGTLQGHQGALLLQRGHGKLRALRVRRLRRQRQQL